MKTTELLVLLACQHEPANLSLIRLVIQEDIAVTVLMLTCDYSCVRLEKDLEESSIHMLAYVNEV